MKFHTVLFAVLALILALTLSGVAHADGGPTFKMPPASRLTVNHVDSDFPFPPFHGWDDLFRSPFKKHGHPEACFPPLVLNSHGQCALPGDETPPDPLPHRIGF